MTGYEVLYLDPGYIGSCPCATVEVDGQRLELHCWRVDLGHDGCGIHYEGSAGRAAALKIKPVMDEMNWYDEWIVVEGYR